MRVKLTFKVIFSKVLFVDLSLLAIKSNDFFISELPINSFTNKELNILANTKGVVIEFLGKDNYIYVRLYVDKAFCQVNLMPTNEDKIKYLTNEIDILSAELNNLINGNN